MEGLGSRSSVGAESAQHLAPLGKSVGIPFLVLSALLAVATLGWFKRRYWGWLLAVAVIATQVLGDAANLFLGHFLQGIVGVLIAGALLLYLLRRDVRSHFQSTRGRWRDYRAGIRRLGHRNNL